MRKNSGKILLLPNYINFEFPWSRQFLGGNSLANDFNTLFKTGLGSDFTIMCEGSKFNFFALVSVIYSFFKRNYQNLKLSKVVTTNRFSRSMVSNIFPKIFFYVTQFCLASVLIAISINRKGSSNFSGSQINFDWKKWSFCSNDWRKCLTRKEQVCFDYQRYQPRTTQWDVEIPLHRSG